MAAWTKMVGSAVLLIGGTAMFVSGGGDRGAVAEQQVQTGTAVVTLPASADPRRVGIGVAGELRIGRQAKLMAENRTWSPVITNVGSSVTNIGPGASVGTLLASGRVVLGDRAIVNGDVIGKGAVERQGEPNVAGQILQNQASPPASLDLSRFEWRAKLSGSSPEPVKVAERQTRTLSGGSYGDVAVGTGAKLTLSGALAFRFHNLTVDPGGIVEVAGKEPTEIDLDGAVLFRGAITTPTASTPPPLTFVAFGADQLVFESTIRALIIAPRGKVLLGGMDRTFYGAVFAKDAELRPDVELHHIEFSLPVVKER